MIHIASTNGYSRTWVHNSGVSESQLCLHCYPVFRLWWRSMCFNSCQLMGYRHWENRTIQEWGITTVQIITSSFIPMTTSLQQSIKMLLSLGFENQRKDNYLGFYLEWFSQNWLYLPFVVTIETELCLGMQMGKALGLKGRITSLSQASARNLEAQHNSYFPLEQVFPWNAAAPLDWEGTLVSDLQIHWWETQALAFMIKIRLS